MLGAALAFGGVEGHIGAFQKVVGGERGILQRFPHRDSDAGGDLAVFAIDENRLLDPADQPLLVDRFLDDAVEIEIRIPDAQTLKDRRQVVRSLLDGARHRFGVSAAEVGGQDTWQSATLAFAVVASEARLVDEQLDAIDRFLWSRPEIEVLDGETHWLA